MFSENNGFDNEHFIGYNLFATLVVVLLYTCFINRRIGRKLEFEAGSHHWFMREALKEAYKAYGKNETPIGAVMVKDGSIIARDIIKGTYE